jgi:F0F1-type ATP synthase epsilon subunit
MIDNNQMTILVNEAEKAVEINPQEAQDTFQIAQKKLAQAYYFFNEGKRHNHIFMHICTMLYVLHFQFCWLSNL